MISIGRKKKVLLSIHRGSSTCEQAVFYHSLFALGGKEKHKKRKTQGVNKTLLCCDVVIVLSYVTPLLALCSTRLNL